MAPPGCLNVSGEHQNASWIIGDQHVGGSFERVRAETTPPKLVVLDLSAAPYVDMHAAHMLAELAASGIMVQAVEARSSVCERLRREGVEGKLGGAKRSLGFVAEVLK